MVTDWYSKRHKVTQVEAEVVLDDQKAVWHAVSYDFHNDFEGKEDLSCGNGAAIMLRCLYITLPGSCGPTNEPQTAAALRPVSNNARGRHTTIPAWFLMRQ